MLRSTDRFSFGISFHLVKRIALDTKHDCVGDVRGMGLFLGVELIEPDGSEATEICAYVKNRIRDHRILIGSEGPKDSILKIRPPLTIEAEDAEMIIAILDQILGECC